MSKTLLIVGMLGTILVAGCHEPPAATRRGAGGYSAAQVELRLVANQDTYTLDLGGQSHEEAQRQSRPAIPQVDLTLEVHNHSGGQVSIPGGVRDWYTLKLEGPGAVDTVMPGMWCLPIPDVAVDAGKSHSVSLQQIHYFRDRRSTFGCWTLPGDYTLTAEAQVRVQGQEVTLRSNPVRLKVVEGPDPTRTRGIVPFGEKPFQPKPPIGGDPCRGG